MFGFTATLERFAGLLAPIRGLAGGRETDAHALVVAEAGAAGFRGARSRGAWVFRLATWRERPARSSPRNGHWRRAIVSSRPVWRSRLAERVLTALEAHHNAEPLSEGMSREEVRERVLGRGAPMLAELVTARSAGRRADRRPRSSRARRPEVSLTAEESRIRDAIDETLRTAFLRPPDLPTLAEAAATSAAAVEKILQLLVRQKAVVRLDGMPFHAAALQRLKAEVRGLKEGANASGSISVATFKDRYGLSRKHAIPLLEYLDRERVTRRVGDARVLL